MIVGREFIDRNGGFQSGRTGVDKLAHDAWMARNTWNLSRDDFIRLSYFHGDMEEGEDGSNRHASDKPGDLVYVSENGSEMSRSTCSYWLNDYSSFVHGYSTCYKEHVKTQESHF